MARDHHLAGQILEQVQERDMVDLLVVEAIAPCRTAGRVQIGGIAVDQLRAQKRERGQKGMGTAMHQLDRVVHRQGLERLRIAVDGDRAHARWLALHQRTAPQVALDVNAVRRHQRNQRLAQTARRLSTPKYPTRRSRHTRAQPIDARFLESRDDQRRGGANPAPATTYIILSRSGAGPG